METKITFWLTSFRSFEQTPLVPISKGKKLTLGLDLEVHDDGVAEDFEEAGDVAIEREV